MIVAVVVAEPKPEPKPQILAYSSPLVAGGFVPSAAVVERSYHGNFAYPYAAAPYAAAPYAFSPYTAQVLYR